MYNLGQISFNNSILEIMAYIIQFNFMYIVLKHNKSYLRALSTLSTSRP